MTWIHTLARRRERIEKIPATPAPDARARECFTFGSFAWRWWVGSTSRDSPEGADAASELPEVSIHGNSPRRAGLAAPKTKTITRTIC